MRVLLFSDPHCHAFRPYSDILPDGMNSRLKDAIGVLHEIEELCQHYAVDGVLCGGDLFHARSTISVRTFNAIYDAVAKIKMYVNFFGLIVGNHDQTDRKGDIYSTHTMNSVVDVMGDVGWRHVVVDKEPLNILAVPHHPDKEFLLNQIMRCLDAGPHTNGPSVLLGHIGISGGKVGANFVLVDEHEINLAELPHSQFDQVFLGHYHIAQKLLPNVRFMGATHQHNWGDIDQERGCWLWDTTADQEFSEPTFVGLQSAPKFIQLPYDNYINPKATFPPKSVNNNFVRMTCPITITADEWAEIAKQIIEAGARRVEPWVEPTAVTVGVDHSEFHPGMDFEEMVEKYVLTRQPSLDPMRLIGLGQAILKEIS